jgi:hypothetical protein
MCFFRSGTPSPSGSQIIPWSDLSTSRAITHSSRPNVCDIYPHPIFDAGWTTGDREARSTIRLDLTSDCRRACEELNENFNTAHCNSWSGWIIASHFLRLSRIR